MKAGEVDLKESGMVPVSITFDDGRISQDKSYFPIMEDFSLKASFYIVTSWIGEPGFMNSEEIVDLWKHHNEIGSHSHTHPRLSTLTDEKLEYELGISRKLLQPLNCCTLAYPFGDYSREVERKAMRHYSAARTYIPSRDGDWSLPYNYDVEKQKYELAAFPMEHPLPTATISLLELPLPKFKNAIEEIINAGIQKKAWSIFVFHGPTKIDFEYIARKLSRHPLHFVRAIKDVTNVIRSGQTRDELVKFRWMCEFLSSNHRICVLTVAETIKYLEHSALAHRRPNDV